VQPVKSRVFQKRDYTWLEELAQIAERESVGSLHLDLQGPRDKAENIAEMAIELSSDIVS